MTQFILGIVVGIVFASLVPYVTEKIREQIRGIHDEDDE
jgi:hypothetical protein